MQRFTTLFLSLLLCISLCPAFAQVTNVPQRMNFHGRLAKPDGTPVANGAYSVRFSLWDKLNGGVEKWNQTINPVNTHNGTFAVLLSGFPAGTFNGNLWLEIEVGADPALTPRQQLVTVAYAMKADTVPDGSIGAAQIANGSITANKFAANIFNPLAWLLGGNSLTNPASHFLGTTDSQPLIFRTNNTERMRIRADGFVGVGRSTKVSGAESFGIFSPSGAGFFGGMYVQTNDLTALPFYGYSKNGGVDAFHYLDGSDGNKWKLYNGGSVLTVLPGAGAGVGIGTTAPNRALTVQSGAGTYLNVKADGGTEEVLLGADAGGGIVSTMTNHDLQLRAGGNFTYMTVKTDGRVGVGTSFPEQNLSVFTGMNIDQFNINNGSLVSGLTFGSGSGEGIGSKRTGGGNQYGLDFYTGFQTRMSIQNDGIVVVPGTTRTGVLEITGGADLAENFDIMGDVKPGMVVEIDPDHEGKLRLAVGACNLRVAGVVSGANRLSAGVVLTDPNDHATNRHPIAMSGRVWVWCDTTENAISPGDLLTTADRPGHAMKVIDHARAAGSILGKAMTSLAKGKVGLVLALVNLH